MLRTGFAAASARHDQRRFRAAQMPLVKGHYRKAVSK